MKVPIFHLALDAAIASYMRQREQHLSSPPSLGGCVQLEQTQPTSLSSLSSLSMFVLARKSKRTAPSCNKSGSTAGAGVGLSEDCRSQSLSQTRLVFSSSFTHTESCWSSGEGESGFPANFFSRKRACLLLERANAEGEFLFFRQRLTGYIVARTATSLSSLALYLYLFSGRIQSWHLQPRCVRFKS